MPGPALTSFWPLVKETSDKLMKGFMAAREQEQLRDAHVQFRSDFLDAVEEETGDEKIERIKTMCNSIPGYSLSVFQDMCLHEILQVFSPAIFGFPNVNELRQKLKKLNMEVPKTKMTALNTSRRGGKTDILTMVAAALLCVCPGAKILFFSIYDHTCEAARQSILDWIELFGYSQNLINNNKKTIAMRVNGAAAAYLKFVGGQNETVYQSPTPPLPHPFTKMVLPCTSTTPRPCSLRIGNDDCDDIY